MNRAKVFLITVLLFIGVSALITGSSCNTDPCKDLFCKNGGSCREGLCRCPDGYTGAYCEAKLADRMIGTFYGYVRKNGSQPTYIETIIVPGIDAKTVNIYQLFGQGTQFFAVVREDNTFEMPEQTNNGITMKGNGYIENNKYIHFFYELTDLLGAKSYNIYDATKQF